MDDRERRSSRGLWSRVRNYPVDGLVSRALRRGLRRGFRRGLRLRRNAGRRRRERGPPPALLGSGRPPHSEESDLRLSPAMFS